MLNPLGLQRLKGIARFAREHGWNVMLENRRTPHLDFPDCDGVLTCAPGFVGAGDYRLADGSPCINKGLNGSYTADSTDVIGQKRIMRRKVDLGCYENQTVYGLQILVR